MPIYIVLNTLQVVPYTLLLRSNSSFPRFDILLHMLTRQVTHFERKFLTDYRVDFKLHVYDTTAPPTPSIPGMIRSRHREDPSLHTTMKVLNTIQGQPGRWTITDTDLSRDNER